MYNNLSDKNPLHLFICIIITYIFIYLRVYLFIYSFINLIIIIIIVVFLCFLESIDWVFVKSHPFRLLMLR